MTLQGLRQDIECYVLDKLSQRFLLGNDFLLKTRAKMDFGSREISFYEDTVSLTLFDNNPSVPLIATLRRTVLPPKSESLVPVRLSRRLDNEVAIIEPLPMQDNQRYVLARTLVKPYRNRTFCRIANPTDHKIYINRNWKLATLDTDLADTISVLDDNNDRYNQYTDVPNSTPTTHFRNNNRNHNRQTKQTRRQQRTEQQDEVSEKVANKYTFEELGIELDRPDMTPEDRQKFVDLINEFGDCFAKTLKDLGGTKLVMHKIDTGDAPPVSRKPYKCSPDAQREITKQVNQMLRSGYHRAELFTLASPSPACKKTPQCGRNPQLQILYRL